MSAVRDDALLVDQMIADGRHCLLDLSAVDFIDSTGVGTLIRLHKKIRALDKQLVLLAPSPNVRRALGLMHLMSFFAVAPDIAAARALITARAREENVPASPRMAAVFNPLVWQGEITATNAETVWRRTEAHVRTLTAAHREVVIDLSAVRFLDSTGAGLMVRSRKLALHEGGQLTFANPPEVVLNVLRLARLEEYLLGQPGGPASTRSG